MFVQFFCNPRQHHQEQPIQIKAYGQVPENIPEEDACSSALNLLRMMKEKRMVENNKKRVILLQSILLFAVLALKKADWCLGPEKGRLLFE